MADAAPPSPRSRRIRRCARLARERCGSCPRSRPAPAPRCRPRRPAIRVIEITALSIGSTSRATRVCKACTSMAAATTGSRPRCGMAAWQPGTVSSIVSSSEAAIAGPWHMAKVPVGDVGPVVQAEHLLGREALEQPVARPSPARRRHLPRPAGRSGRPCRRSCGSRPDNGRRRAAWWCGRHGRRRASGPPTWTTRPGRSPPSIGSASMSARSPIGRPPAAPVDDRHDAGSGRRRYEPRRPRSRAASRRRTRRSRAPAKPSSGRSCRWRRQAVSSSWYSAMRLTIGNEALPAGYRTAMSSLWRKSSPLNSSGKNEPGREGPVPRHEQWRSAAQSSPYWPSFQMYITYSGSLTSPFSLKAIVPSTVS